MMETEILQMISDLVSTGGKTALWALILVQGTSLAKALIGWSFALVLVKIIFKFIMNAAQGVRSK